MSFAGGERTYFFTNLTASAQAWPFSLETSM